MEYWLKHPQCKIHAHRQDISRIWESQQVTMFVQQSIVSYSRRDRTIVDHRTVKVADYRNEINAYNQYRTIYILNIGHANISLDEPTWSDEYPSQPSRPKCLQKKVDFDITRQRSLFVFSSRGQSHKFEGRPRGDIKLWQHAIHHMLCHCWIYHFPFSNFSKTGQSPSDNEWNFPSGHETIWRSIANLKRTSVMK